MARGRRPRRRAAPAPPPVPPPATPRGLGLARIVGRVAAFLEARGERLLRWVATALLRRLTRARWGVGEGEAAGPGRGDSGSEGHRDGADPHEDKLLRAEDDSGAIAVQEDEPPDESATAPAPLVEQDADDESATAGVIKNATTPAPLDGPGQDRTAGAANNVAAAKNAGAGAASKNPKRKSKAPPPRPRGPRPAPPRPRPPPPDPFEGGYNIGELYREREDRDDEVALSYATFCSSRALQLSDKKGREVCDICYFHLGLVRSFDKERLEKHCVECHSGSYLCQSKGCVVRCKTVREAGLHYHYLHEQSHRDWWRHLLEKHGIEV